MIGALVLMLLTGAGDGRVEALDGGDPKAGAAARIELLATQGPEREAAARELLQGFAAQTSPARRRRASVLAELAGPAQLPAILGLLHDSDPRVRSSWVALLARPDLGPASGEVRVTALARLAEVDPDPGLRRRSVEALGALDTAPAVAALAALIERLPSPERVWAVQALPATARSAQLVEGLVRPDRSPVTPSDVLVEALALYGRLMADGLILGGATRGQAGLALARALRHPDPRVQEAAADAFIALVHRFRELGQEESERAQGVLLDLAQAGVDPRLVHHHRAVLAFFPGVDPATARQAARAIRAGLDRARAGARMGALSRGDGARPGLWLFRSWYLEGLAELALGRFTAARVALDRAGDAIDGLLADRRDLGDDAALLDHVDLCHQRALAEVASALVELALGAEPAQPEVLDHILAAHRLTIEAQGDYARVRGEATTGWDALFDTQLSPYRLLFTGVSHPGLAIGEMIDLQRGLGSALAAVSPAEMPGFVPPPGLQTEVSDPLVDPQRRALLEEAALARLEGLSDRIDRLTARLSQREGAGWELPEDQLDELSLLNRRRRVLQQEWASEDQAQGLRELRVPGSQALWLARDLRDEGRGAEARAVARAMQADLERNGVSRWWYYHGQTLLVRADLVVGSAYTDEDEPLRAEEALRAAVSRLEGLERQLAENGAGPGTLAPYRALRSTALVSLAVNANVKLGDSDKALGYYEQAYELRQDEFMTVLLACYRARSGREQEARDLLRQVRPGPQTWYNLACTHALLGDSEEALDWLEHELRENHASEASRDRQRAWARDDPDLGPLRGDPRFEALVGAR